MLKEVMQSAIMQSAEREARRFNHEYIGTEHILLGLIKQQKGEAFRILSKLGVDLNKIYSNIERRIVPGKESVIQEKFLFLLTPRAKMAIEHAVKEARISNCPFVGTEHLLIGLLCEKESIACMELGKFGVNLEQVLLRCGVKSKDVQTKIKKLLTNRKKKTTSPKISKKKISKKKEKPVKCKVFIIKTIPASEIIGDDSTDMCETEKDIKTFLRDKKFIDAKQSSVIFKTKAGGHEYICTLITIFYQNKDS